MTSRDFVYWLQGFFEIADPNKVTPEQVKIIKNHLAMVFKHEIDPSFGDVDVQKALHDLHKGKPGSDGGSGGVGGGFGPIGPLINC